jgi:predicted phosphodiesterase
VAAQGGSVRIAALYDIHGNIHALDAVLAEVIASDADIIVGGGDVASGPFPAQTIERLMALPAPARFVMGNADRELIEAFDRPDPPPPANAAEATTQWCARQLLSRHVDFLRSFDATVTLGIEGDGSTLFCHGSPRSDEELITPATPAERVEPMLLGLSAKTVICGHTHMQFDRRISGIRLLNAGSVGMPYEKTPGAYWAMVAEGIQLRCTAYDLDAAAVAIAATDWPMAKEFALENVLTVPSPEEAIAIFEPGPVE